MEALRQAGLQAGDELVVVATGAGRITMVRAEDLVALHAGKGAGDYGPEYLQALRGEWR